VAVSQGELIPNRGLAPRKDLHVTLYQLVCQYGFQPSSLRAAIDSAKEFAKVTEQQKLDRQQAKEMKNAEIREEEQIRKSIRAVKRRSEEKSSMPS
jgi:hypothetical protein